MFLEKVKTWRASWVCAAKRFAQTPPDIATRTMVVTLLALAWIFLGVGFTPLKDFDPNAWGYHLVFAILLLLPAVLALALGSFDGVALALPYVGVVGMDLFTRLMMWVEWAAGTPESVERYLHASLLVLYITPGILILCLRILPAERRLRVYRQVCALQMLLLLGAAYYFTFQYEVRHLAKPVVNVRSVRFWTMPLSPPLIEEDVAYMVDRGGRLFRVQLATGRKRVVARIPTPTPALTELPANPFPPDPDPYLRPFNGVLSRTEAGEILFRYEHIAVQGIMEFTFNEDTREVRWQAHRYGDAPPIHPWPPPSPFPRPTLAIGRQGQIAAIVGGDGLLGGHNITIRGENINTLVASRGRFEFEGIHAGHGWALVRPHHRWFPWVGRLMIISIDGR